MELNGLSLETAWWGPGPDAAPTLVLLHEGLGCVALWRDFPQALAAATGCGVFAYSRPGYGQSDARPLPLPLTYMHDEAARAADILTSAGITRAILLGHSDGASIAAIAAGSAYDARVRGLILIAPHFFVEEDGLRSIAAARDAYREGKLRTRLARYHRNVDAAFGGWSGAWLDPAFRSWRIDEYLPHIRLPILVIQGEADPYGSVAHVEAVQLQAYGPVVTLLLPDTGHEPHTQAAVVTLAAIAEFCQRIVAAEPAL